MGGPGGVAAKRILCNELYIHGPPCATLDRRSTMHGVQSIPSIRGCWWVNTQTVVIVESSVTAQSENQWPLRGE